MTVSGVKSFKIYRFALQLVGTIDSSSPYNLLNSSWETPLLQCRATKNNAPSFLVELDERGLDGIDSEVCPGYTVFNMYRDFLILGRNGLSILP